MKIDNRPTRRFAFFIFLLGELFLLILFLLSFSPGGVYPHGKTTYYIVILIAALFWNTYYAYVILNCPIEVFFDNNLLSVKWNKIVNHNYILENIKITKISWVKVIKIYDVNWKLPRLLVLNGWSKSYQSLVEQIEIAKS